MKKLILLLLLVLLTISIQSCKKDTTPTCPSCGVNNNNSLTAEITGDVNLTFNSTTVLASYSQSDLTFPTHISSTTYIVNGNYEIRIDILSSDVNKRVFNINGVEAQASLIVQGQVPITYGSNNSGTLTLTSVTSDGFTGTFSFSAAMSSDKTRMISIDNGKITKKRS